MSIAKRSLAAAAIVFVAFGAGYSLAAFNPKAETVVKSADLEFVNINPAIQMAHAYGNRGEGAHGSFGRFPAQFTTPFHTHSGAYHGVVVKGTMTNPFKGEETPPEMEPGSYWYVPANSVHATACVSKEPCEFYFYADSAFDFTPVE
jgi:quercetin dioxygenase-like cupin family protein